jgi:hypothetical protein
MSERWERRSVEDFRVGDTIENPANQAGETVVKIDTSKGLVTIQWTGWHERMVPQGTKFWGLAR